MEEDSTVPGEYHPVNVMLPKQARNREQYGAPSLEYDPRRGVFAGAGCPNDHRPDSRKAGISSAAKSFRT